MSSPAPGWYPDPAGTAPSQQRWWNGDEWTEQTRDGSDVAEPVGFAEAIRRGFLDWSRGRRASRSEFWWLVLFAQIAASVTDAVLGTPVATVAWLAGVVVIMKAGVRRYRDAGRPGWLYLAHTVVGGAGWFVALVGALVAGLSAWGNDGETAGVAVVVAGVGLLVALVVGVWSLVVLCSKGRPRAPHGDGSPQALPVINGA